MDTKSFNAFWFVSIRPEKAGFLPTKSRRKTSKWSDVGRVGRDRFSIQAFLVNALEQCDGQRWVEKPLVLSQLDM